MNFLPNDIARCRGVGSDEEGWREGCETCLRRMAPRNGIGPWIAPPMIVVFECENLIEPEKEQPNRTAILDKNAAEM